MRTARALLAAAVISAPALILGAGPASAAAPTNDVVAGALPLVVGEPQVLDTTEATTDSVDAGLNAGCGAPATDASVWYSYAPAADGRVVVDVRSSSYTAGVLVATGDPDSLSLVTCGRGAVLLHAAAGTTYSILAFDDQFDGGGNGGTLHISVEDVPDAPTVSLAVDPVGLVDARTGTATLTGSLTCTGGEFVAAFGQLTQRVGRGTVEGSFFLSQSGTCDGTPQPWTAEVPARNGKFAGGKSASFTFSFTCGLFECGFGFDEQTVQLRGGKR